MSVNERMERSRLVRVAARDGRIRAFAADTTEVVAELQSRHGTYPAVTAALGRLATGALLLGSMLKEPEHQVTLRVQGDGPAGTLLASATGAGDVRGLVTNPRPEVDQARDGKLNVSGVVGRNGQIRVTRDLGMRHPYSSAVELVSGEIGDDLASYLARSEQVPSAVGIGVFVRADGSVEAAGGYIVQLMPGATEDDAARIEAAIRSLPHPTTMLRAGETPEQILDRIFPEGYDTLATMGVRFHCPCSRDRAERALVLLGAAELSSLREKDADQGHSELVCEFCKTPYRFTGEEIDALIAAARADA
ncbi:MAG TPA: Hsp33 family molecular chaperone HslO [Longimicrobiales bacterium]